MTGHGLHGHRRRLARCRVYAQLPGGQNVPVGSYSDTVVATITF